MIRKTSTAEPDDSLTSGQSADQSKKAERKIVTRVLGVDPGTASCGWGVVEHRHRVGDRSYSLIDYGVIRTYPDQDMGERLMVIFDQLIRLIDQTKPSAIALERLFFFRNQKTVMHVAQAQGAILMAAWEMGRPVYFYTPMQVKLTITNEGRADKNYVQRMVRQLLNMTRAPQPDDAADGLAVALCHLHCQKREEGMRAR